MNDRQRAYFLGMLTTMEQAEKALLRKLVTYKNTTNSCHYDEQIKELREKYGIKERKRKAQR
jgi:hypothetical protein